MLRQNLGCLCLLPHQRFRTPKEIRAARGGICLFITREKETLPTPSPVTPCLPPAPPEQFWGVLICDKKDSEDPGQPRTVSHESSITSLLPFCSLPVTEEGIVHVKAETGLAALSLVLARYSSTWSFASSFASLRTWVVAQWVGSLPYTFQT